jgi:hypothetical protein
MKEEVYIELLKRHICKAVADADECKSKLPAEVLDIEGMSGRKTRHLYNNICDLPNAKYLEVGTYKGSSFVSAFYRNMLDCYCIDNWSQFGGKKDFENNINMFSRHVLRSIKVVDQDCWTVQKDDLVGPIDIFLYDGAHTYEDHKKAITHFAPFLSKISIIMVDDWMCDWADVKKGTMDGIQESGLEILFQYNIGLSIPHEYHQDGDTFWNGCGILLCKKQT